jgi:predicted DNA-binding protein YlxM (UPF0122 family)
MIDIEKELLESLYWGNQYSKQEISKIFNCTRKNIAHYMKELNIPTRSRSESIKVSDNGGRFKKGIRNNPGGEFKKGIIPFNYIYIEPELLSSLYLGNQYSITIISKLLSISRYSIYTKLKKLNIPIRNVSEGLTIYCIDKHGKNSYNWKGGTTPLHKLERNSKKFKIWREEVFKRDNYTCQVCYKRGGFLHAHHVKKFSKYPELRFDISNGITLCVNDHIAIHKRRR